LDLGFNSLGMRGGEVRPALCNPYLGPYLIPI